MSAPDSPDRFIDVIELARVRATVQGRLDLDRCERLRSFLGGGEGTLAYRLEGHADSHGRAAVRLILDGELPLVCDRCGGIVRHHVDRAEDFYFVEDEAELARLPIVVDEPEPLQGGRSFDLAALVEDEVILSLPISPRHDGCSPRAATAIEDSEAKPGPFAGLQELLRKGK